MHRLAERSGSALIENIFIGDPAGHAMAAPGARATPAGETTVCIGSRAGSSTAPGRLRTRDEPPARPDHGLPRALGPSYLAPS